MIRENEDGICGREIKENQANNSINISSETGIVMRIVRICFNILIIWTIA